MYFVVECTTTSAPSSSGCCRYGEAKVLSTTSSAPASWAICATIAMSATFSSGLVGVSSQTTLVLPGRIASRIASGCVTAAGVISTPQVPSTRANRRNVPPYASSGNTTWSPGTHSERIRVSSAARPLANANPRLPASIAARHSSSAVRVGFADREYS